MQNKEALLTLNMIHQIGSLRIKRLLDAFGNAENVLSASESKLQAVEDIGRVIARGIVTSREKIDCKKELDLISEHEVRIISIDEPEYPQNLKDIYDPPVLIYVKGQIKPEDNLAIAIVGSRRASFYGLSMAEKLSAELAGLGITVVSGMARGIDSKAHWSALKAGGRTIAVLGSGLACIYPEENKNLFNEIAKSGAVISEFPMQTKPLKGNFPRRNRVISGLSLGVVVAEASRNSGALITADCALEQNREVFAVPGKVDSLTSFGTNRLIKQGAKLISSVEDILEELKIDIRDKIAKSNEAKKSEIIAPSINLTQEEGAILKNIASSPRHIDEIIDDSGLPASLVMSALMQMEMKHLIKQLPGKLFVRAVNSPRRSVGAH